MFCSQCGKKLKDNMLFCPNCGVALEIPDDDEVIAVPDEAAEGREEPVLAKGEEEMFFPEEVEPEVSVEDEPAVTPALFAEEEEPAVEEEEPKAEERARTKVPEMPPIRRTPAEAPEAAPAEAVDSDEEEITFDEEEAPFVPLAADESDPGEMAWEKFEPKVERRPPDIGGRDDDGMRLNGHAPQLRGRGDRPAARTDPRRRPEPAKAARPARTYVPPKAPDPDDMFMDGQDDYDEVDDFDMEYADYPEGEFEYEDDVEGSFFFRHIRGIMGLSLLALLVLVCMIYVFSSTGQIALAKMNLAWNPDVYSKVAYEYYESGLYEMSGSFYEKALARDEDNYNYAISAASAYIYGEDTEKAAGMLKKSIAIDPARPEPYIYLMNIYPDAATRPWDITQLLQQGYGRTGDDRLKAFAQ